MLDEVLEEPRPLTAWEMAREYACIDELDEHFAAVGMEVEKPNARYADAAYRRLSSPRGQWIVAYKTDWHVHDTKQFFLPTEIVYENGTIRSAWTGDRRFDAFVIYSPQEKYLWWIPAREIRERLRIYARTYATHSIENAGERVTYGITVPRTEIEKYAKRWVLETLP